MSSSRTSCQYPNHVQGCLQLEHVGGPLEICQGIVHSPLSRQTGAPNKVETRPSKASLPSGSVGHPFGVWNCGRSHRSADLASEGAHHASATPPLRHVQGMRLQTTN